MKVCQVYLDIILLIIQQRLHFSKSCAVHESVFGRHYTHSDLYVLAYNVLTQMIAKLFL